MNAADPSFRRRAIAAIAVSLVSGAIGYGISHTSPTAGSGVAEPDAARTQGALPELVSPAADMENRKAYLAKLRALLLMEIRTSPEIYVDYEMKRELHRHLAGLSTAELEALFKHPPEGRMQEIRTLESWILRAWVLKDPPAALHASGEGCVDVFNTWGYHEREAALTWLRDAEVTGPLEGKKQHLRINFMIWLARIDFERAKQEWSCLDEAERKSTLVAWTDSPEAFLGHRDALLDFISSQLDGSTGKNVDRDLLARLAAVDAEAARTRAEKTESSPAERAEMEVAILKGQARRDPEAAFAAWLDRHPADQPVPEAFGAVLDQSILYHEKETIQWLDSLQPGTIRDFMHERGSHLVATRGKFDKAAAYIDGISDPVRKTNATAVLKTLWMRADPGKAREWLERSRGGE